MLVFATSPALVTPDLGVPTALTLTNATGLPVAGLSNLGTNVGAWLITPSSANLLAAITDETGTGLAVFATSPVLTTPNLGIPSALTLTNATGLPLAGLPATDKVRSCTVSLGDGLNAVPAGTYPLLGQCKNDTGATLTLSGLKCLSDNNGTTSCNAADSAANGLLTGAVTATNAFATGTQSATTTIATGVWINVTFIADGTSKVISLDIVGTL